MLKRIAISDVILGMYIHEMCGSWLDHPFWKRRFLLDTESDLLRLRKSAVNGVLIDTSKGLDVPATTAPLIQAEPKAEKSATVAVDQSHVQVSFAEELQRAEIICRSAKAAVAEMFSDVRMGKAIEVERAMEQVEEIARSIHRHPHALLNLARLKTANEYTYMHSVAVCGLMIALARQLDMDPQQVREAGVAGLLHDIGKSGIQDAIINKPDKLSDSEWKLVRKHPEIGHELLQGCGRLSRPILDVCLHHHEKMDGTGYPLGLCGERIPLFARMGAVCDVYDAVTSNRAYKTPWDPAEALHRMAQWNGHFDKGVLYAFVKALGIFPVGAQVRLQSGRIGMVMEQNGDSLLRPRIQLLSSQQDPQPAEVQFLDLAVEPQPDRIVAREPSLK